MQYSHTSIDGDYTCKYVHIHFTRTTVGSSHDASGLCVRRFVFFLLNLSPTAAEISAMINEVARTTLLRGARALTHTAHKHTFFMPPFPET